SKAMVLLKNFRKLGFDFGGSAPLSPLVTECVLSYLRCRIHDPIHCRRFRCERRNHFGYCAHLIHPGLKLPDQILGFMQMIGMKKERHHLAEFMTKSFEAFEHVVSLSY